MARTVRDTKLETRAARERLKARGKPYWRELEPGCHLGYRRLSGKAGRWCVRHYCGGQVYQVETLNTADDYSDADGVAILNYRQAQAAARNAMVERAHTAAGKRGPLTVKDAIANYLASLAEEGKSIDDATYRVNALILPSLGDIEVSALTKDRLKNWHATLAKAPPRRRTKAGETPPRVTKPDSGEDARRRRRSTANRTLTILKAALNYAWREGHTQSDDAWRRVKPFGGVEAARLRYLTNEEARRLINACGDDPDLRLLVQAALQTGCRYGELARLTVSDFNPDSEGTIVIRQSKSGKPRHVYLSDEGVAFFRQVCAGRAGSALMFMRHGEPWGKSNAARPMRLACARAKIEPPIGVHALRHTFASLALMNGAPLLVVAQNLGHSDTRMVEKHYGHLAKSYVADAIRAAAPRFGFQPDKKVAAIGGSSR